MRVRLLLLLGVLAFATIVHVQAQEVEPERGWLSSFGHRISSWMPWSKSEQEIDSTDTLQKVEEIYERTHKNAQERVDDLKESRARGRDVNVLVAEIYQEEAQRAEREIEALKHPMLEWLLHWREHTPQSDSLKDSAKGLGQKAREKFEDLSSRARNEVEDLSSKVAAGYRSALSHAKDTASTAASATAGAVPSWEEAKARAARLYSDAFHTGHGTTRTFLGKMRDSVGRGMSKTAHFAKAAACQTWSLFTHSLLAIMYGIGGGLVTMWGLSYLGKRRFHKQLDSHVAGPIIAVGEYLVMGNDDFQRKFFDYWSGPGRAYFSRQPGMVRQWIHRGVSPGNNLWLSYSEWASIEDLRRACQTHEFHQLRKRAPSATATNMIIYQLQGSSGTRIEGEVVDLNKDKHQVEDAGLRQRGTTTTATHTT